MKIYNSLEEINACLNSKKQNKKENAIELNEQDRKIINNSNKEKTSSKNKNEKAKNSTFEEIEYFDNVKTRVLKYVIYKKRTKEEVKRKFGAIYSKEILDEVIDNLVELGYINDNEYIDRAVKEFIALKSMSLKELKFKLMSKGLNSKIIDVYFEENYDMLQEYEKKSAKNITIKKSKTMDEFEIKRYLIRRGFKFI